LSFGVLLIIARRVGPFDEHDLLCAVLRGGPPVVGIEAVLEIVERIRDGDADGVVRLAVVLEPGELPFLAAAAEVAPGPEGLSGTREACQCFGSHERKSRTSSSRPTSVSRPDSGSRHRDSTRTCEVGSRWCSLHRRPGPTPRTRPPCAPRSPG